MSHTRDYSDEIASTIDEEVRRLIESAHDEAWEILVTYREVLDDLVLQLMDKETLSRNEVLADLRADPDPPLPRLLHRVRQAAALGPPAGPDAQGTCPDRGRRRQGPAAGNGQSRFANAPAAGLAAAFGNDDAMPGEPRALPAVSRVHWNAAGPGGRDGRKRRSRVPAPRTTSRASGAPAMRQTHSLSRSTSRGSSGPSGRSCLAIGEDPDRDGLADTPARVARAYAEQFSGLSQHPEDVLGTVFDADHDEMILVRDIEVYSTCEHHLVPFFGRAHVAYIPNEKGQITGLSKLARLVDIYARRPQVQERMTSQIADALMRVLEPRGALVVIEAEHLCMSMRGVRKPGAKTVTSAVRGIIRDSATTRAEAMSLLLHRG